jgi:DNA transformation protein
LSASNEFVHFVRELLAPLGPLTGSQFFGGQAMKYQGRQFAMVMGNTLYFRVNDATRPEFEKRGCPAFSYANKTKRVQVRQYFAVPEALFDDPQLMLAWARQAVDAAAEA